MSERSHILHAVRLNGVIKDLEDRAATDRLKFDNLSLTFQVYPLGQLQFGSSAGFIIKF